MAEQDPAPQTPTERPAEPGPRTWRPDGPGSFQAPAGVTAVRDRASRLWTRDGTRWTCTGTRWIRWRVLVAEHGPLTEQTTPARWSRP
ncbi:hypothetical protein [Streptomyces sp. SAI-127]|uniref:hypothetical protein n=1 Tax=Streptomyces sp. SAI-127 TaxID=2940543 RepID=UPI002472F87F|nr:hypothetical protein [Streptomyces sp. SAI-127]MDH6489597.1 hypothetical protein [Streptomyces sp. SAI-127]